MIKAARCMDTPPLHNGGGVKSSPRVIVEVYQYQVYSFEAERQSLFTADFGFIGLVFPTGAEHSALSGFSAECYNEQAGIEKIIPFAD